MSTPIEGAFAGETLYQLVLGGIARDVVRVHAFSGRERLSRGWRLDIEATAPDLGDPAALLGRRAAFVMRAGPAPRAFSGVVAAVRTLGRDARHQHMRYRLRVASPLEVLRHKRRSRIFQDQRVDAIVTRVLDEAGIACAWRAIHDPPTREYATQFEETDWQFVARLLAESGIAFRHAHPEARALAVEGEAAPGDAERLLAGDRLVLGDDASLYLRLAGDALHWRGDDGDGSNVAAFDRVTRFARGDRLHVGAAAYWEYDPERPEAMLTAAARAGAGPEGRGALEYYAHHGQYHFRKWEFGRAEAERILRQKRRRARVVEGASTCPALEPGAIFRLEGHAVEANDREHAVIAIRHEGWATQTAERRETYRNRFECVPAEVIYCPPRPKRDKLLVALTATVVGAGDDEIHTDEAGRIKVQFHWDREGKRDAASSCWIRTMHAWGGAGWGSQFIPRVGMEVVVTFDGGDADKPLVLGCVYNGTHPLPFRDKTRSGLVTKSTPRADGHNELSFDDAAGAEQVLLRAERDLVEHVGHDHTANVVRDQRLSVGGDLATRVAGARAHETLGRESEKILGDSELCVGGERREAVGGGARRTIDGDELVRVGGNAVRSVRGTASLRSDGNYGVEVGTREKPANVDVFAWGHTVLGSGLGVALRSDQRITLSCGESSIEIGKDEIKLSAPKLRFAAEKELAMSGDGPHVRLDKHAEIAAETVKIYSSKAAIELDEHAHVDGQMVKLACALGDPGPLVDDAGTPLKQPLRLKLADAKYQPYANKEFVVKAGGARVEGTTGGDGGIDVQVPSEAQAAEITVWLGKRPGGPARRYVVDLVKPEPPTTVKGAQQRLRHLGYYFRTPTGELDAATRHALEDFQKDHALPITGKVDDATRAKLEDAHGH